MRMLTQELCMILAMATFFAMIYVTFLCMYLAPTDRLRRWGAITYYRLFVHGTPVANPVKNEGAVVHDFSIKRRGEETDRDADLGKSATTTVTFAKPSTYEFICEEAAGKKGTGLRQMTR